MLEIHVSKNNLTNDSIEYLLELISKKNKSYKKIKESEQFLNSTILANSKLFRLKTLNLADNYLKAFEVESNIEPQKSEKI